MSDEKDKKDDDLPALPSMFGAIPMTWPKVPLLDFLGTPNKPLVSPVDNKPIKTVDETIEEWYHKFRLWYADLIIDRATNPSTLEETNTCAWCKGDGFYHHCLFDTCTGPAATRTEECLHPRPTELAEYDELRKRYLFKVKEARFIARMP